MTHTEAVRNAFMEFVAKRYLKIVHNGRPSNEPLQRWSLLFQATGKGFRLLRGDDVILARNVDTFSA